MLTAMAKPDRPLPDGYEFVRVIGAGGFGEVMLARHKKLGRLVAIKRIHDYSLSDPESLDRFVREAKLLAITEAPSVVRVYDLIRFDGHVQLVMEYAPGQSLSDLIAGGPLPASEALVILRDVANALSVATTRGITHRDVKPGNVFVLPDGHAKLGDFGLARLTTDPAIFRTAGPGAMGTPAYFPPELGQGLSEPDERSDAYSFAVMAYEMLTGKLPFEAENLIALVTAHWRLDPTDPATHLPGFPDAGTKALISGLAKDPAVRASPTALVDALERVRADQWPTVMRSTVEKRIGRSDPTVLGIGGPEGFGTPAKTSGRPSPQPTKRRTSRNSRIGALALLAVSSLVGLVFWSPWTSKPTLPAALTIKDVMVTTIPVSGLGTCPAGSYTFVGQIATNGAAGALTIQWTRPDGKQVGERTVQVSSGQTTVSAQLNFRVTGDRPLVGRGTLRVLRPDSFAASKKIRYTCPSR
jgi:serine/threonine protein kinase